MKNDSNFPHLGAYIKSQVIPKGTTVTKAAELLGVGRPALSNLLNGKASLSTDMAKRLEQVFNYPSKNLLAKQSIYSEAKAPLSENQIITKTYVPPFLNLKANDIEQWASSQISARTRLPVFIRTLVNSTGFKLTKVDFPGNDDGERPEWDGYVEADEATPWIPRGVSGWEFGVNANPKGKADDDYKKSVKNVSEQDRASMTFVFITPRRWTGKNNWVESKKSEKLWGDVRAYDASDLEQWLEQSLAAQAWLANETHATAKGVRTLEKCWTDWATVSEPPLSKMLFHSSVQASKRIVLSRLSKPVEGPIIIAADSTEEGLAFISLLLSENDENGFAHYRDQTLVFDEPGTLSKLAESSQTFIPVIYDRKIEQELAPYAHKFHSIVVYPHNVLNTEPHVILKPASEESFNIAMEDMGKNRDEIHRLAIESGRSPTVLRRRLSKVPAVQLPHWASEYQTKIDLVPFLFIGAWNSQNDADKCCLELISGKAKYSQLEREFRKLAQLNDSPVWMTDGYYGVVSKIDLLFAISTVVTSEDLKRFFEVSKIVLGEDNPALDLDEDKRWAASIYGKTREFSGVFRESISETLVLLSIHGDTLFKNFINFSVSAEISGLVKELLDTPLTIRTLEANQQDLPLYAEAAPNEFLSILESDLKSADPVIKKLMRPVGTGIFHHPSRTGLLWALESLSWNPLTFPRSVSILAELAQIEIEDNWANKPINSLLSIFKSWMPQTATNLETRIMLVKRIISKYPYVGWKICINQFHPHNTIGDYNRKPKWRTDGYGFGEPLKDSTEIQSFINEMLSLALNRDEYTFSMLTDLLDRIRHLGGSHQEQIWLIIKKWAETKATDKEKAQLREKIRITLFSRRAVKKTSLSAFAREVYENLEPKDLLNKYSWLFQQGWPEASVDEFEENEDLDFKTQEERVMQLRSVALKEILTQKGIPGLMELANQGNCPREIGWLCSKAVMDKVNLVNLLRQSSKVALTKNTDSISQKSLVSGALAAFENEIERETVIQQVAEGMSLSEYTELLLLAPFRKSIWMLAKSKNADAEKLYWSKVTPSHIYSSEEENIEAVYRLLDIKRPRAAFTTIQYHLDKIEIKLLYRLLSDIARGEDEDTEHYRLDSYHVRTAFKLINATTKLTLDEKAWLEFAYMEMLSSRSTGERSSNSIPNLEKYIENHPEVFVQAITWAYKRKDELSDPEELQISDKSRDNLAKRGYHLLEALTLIPGQNNLGELEIERLRLWVSRVRGSCNELSRAEVGDLCIGKLFSSSPIGKDGLWPCEEVREVIEEIQSEPMMEGIRTGVFNSRGVTTRSFNDGGNQERELAEKYRAFGNKLLPSHPYVATNLLFSIAESYEYDAEHHDAAVNIRARLVKG
ncbi:helix-turn-helix domain-containing protein [Rheinheimera sediminis]|uniref:helix-turn-helix transcriptional regulator n=1 Tax=Rheinheimera sp. YQF-1 TaxID=2499626 RepID=UPI000FD70863|nr:helix-turn-helix domain-containing protein [Rheinheimera sp. YQF-1]RVT44734.1 helix-turn-helix domain-containing protein [Rheinheimera sp. YQF-1]